MKATLASRQSTEPRHTNVQVNGNCLEVGEALKLNLGGRDTQIPGFKTVDLKPGPTVDYQSDISDLSFCKDGTVDEIYASHCLEHFSHQRTLFVLEEWHRVLKRGAKCYISVPDFEAAIKLYLEWGMTDYVRNLLWGDQGYDLAYHYAPFTFPVLLNLLHKAGFKDVKRMTWMPHKVMDCSRLVDTVDNKPVSLTVEATA